MTVRPSWKGFPTAGFPNWRLSKLKGFPTDGVANWRVFPNNLVLVCAQPGAWEHRVVFFPQPVRVTYSDKFPFIRLPLILPFQILPGLYKVQSRMWKSEICAFPGGVSGAFGAAESAKNISFFLPFWRRSGGLSAQILEFLHRISSPSGFTSAGYRWPFKKSQKPPDLKN